MRDILIAAALILHSFHVSAETLAVPTREGNASSAGQTLKYACQIAGSLRLALASVKCDCKAANTCRDGQLPSDAADCASSSDSQAGKGAGASYKLGSRPKLGNIVDPAPGGSIDCSGYISAGLCRAGIPFAPGKVCKDMTTADMISEVEGGKACYESIPASVSGSGKPSLMPGDIVVYKHAGGAIGHVFAIDRLDPTNCKMFSMIQSGGSTGGMGIFLNKGGAVSGDQGEAQRAAEEVNCGANSNANDKIKVVRYNPNKSGCAMDTQQRRLKNESCVQSCDVGRMDGR